MKLLKKILIPVCFMTITAGSIAGNPDESITRNINLWKDNPLINAGFTNEMTYANDYQPGPDCSNHFENKMFSLNDSKINMSRSVKDQSIDQQGPDRQGVLWKPYLEWTLSFPGYKGNPFDLPAKVVFTHRNSGKQITTWMFYDGDDTWKFRFTGTLKGLWIFESFSEVATLSGYKGRVIIEPNPDINARGFIMAHGSQFVRQGPSQHDFDAFIPNVWMNYRKWGNTERCGWTDISSTFADSSMTGAFLDDAWMHGMNGVHAIITNQWFTRDVSQWDQIDNENPDPETFRALEKAIVQAHNRGMYIHIWAWGDEQRRWTPVGLTGGINGEADRRIQRYIAARLGPLPGWTIEFGFDPWEWVTTDQAAEWIDYMQEHLGWPRLMSARDERDFFTPENANYLSHNWTHWSRSEMTRNFYKEALLLLKYSANRPVWLTQRFTWMRHGIWDMPTTRRALWQFAMAGGAGSIWGYFPSSCPAHYSDEEYDDRKQLSTYRDFWHDHFLLDMEPDNDLSEGALVLRKKLSHFVFYQEDTDVIHMDLSSVNGPIRAIALDTKGSYYLKDLGEFLPGDHNWQAPYQSDWVILLGRY